MMVVMMNIRVIILFFLLCSIPFSLVVNSQNNTSFAWEEVVEQLSVIGEESGVNSDNLIEELIERIQEPLNLNTVTKEQLEQFFFLTDIQIENLLAYIYIHGQMQTVYELQMVEEMDRQTIRYLLPFVYVELVPEKVLLPSFREVMTYGKNEITTRFDIPFYERKGYKKEYLGPPLYNSLRYNFRYKDNLYAGFTAEKDAGEPFGALHNKKGYDYYSFYFYLKNVGKLKTLALGNYRLSFGQGLVLSNDFIIGKTSSASTIFSRNNSIKKHSSTDEYNYFRGIAGAVQFRDFVVSGFYSHRALDGIATKESITSIHKTGLHRTEKEAARKEIFSLQLAGGNIAYQKNNLKLGVTGIYYFFDRPYNPQIKEYSKYNLRGNDFHNIGIDYKYRWKRFTLLGETAFGKGDGRATLNSVVYTPTSAYQIIVAQRYYARDYWALFARSLSEGGYVQNESGYYMAVDASPFRRWRLFMSADFFRFPWWKYLVDKPSSGFDGIAQLTYSPHSTISMFLRFQYKQKEKNYTDEDKVKTVRALYHRKLRYRLNYSPSTQLSFRSTVDYNSINPQGGTTNKGFLFTQMVSYTFAKIPLNLEFQGGYFHTDDYASRVYSYEKGMLYSFYSPSFYGIGSRFMIHLRYDIHSNWMVMLKYGQSTYNDRDQIGSGNELIDSNKKQDLQMLLRLKF